MTDFSDERQARETSSKAVWIQHMRRTNKHHAQYYCIVHGNYIGYNNFSPCKDC